MKLQTKRKEYMKKRNYIIASALIAGATVGTSALATVPMVSATSTDEQSIHLPPDLDEETHAELESMTEEERQEWLESHKPEGTPPELDEETKAMLDAMTEEERQDWLTSHRPELPPHEDGERPGKPADMTDEEWEQKRAEMDEMLNSMTDEERDEWFNTHKPGHDRPEPASSTNTVE